MKRSTFDIGYRVGVVVVLLALVIGIGFRFFGLGKILGDWITPDPVKHSRISSAVHFVERAEEIGLTFRHRNGATGEHHIAETLGSGVGVFDFDRDGDLDVYLVQSGPLLGAAVDPGATDRLFRNDSGRFVDVTESAGLTSPGYGFGVAIADADGDGWADVFVTRWGADVLYRNRGDGTFEDVTSSAGLADDGFATSAAWFDLEDDGDLDLYVCHYVVSADVSSAPWCGRRDEGLRFTCHPGAFPAEPDRLYRNRGDGTFEDVSESSGIGGVVPGRGLGVVGSDIDRDGDLDLYVANDTTENFLFENRGDGTFAEIGALAGVAFNAFGEPEAGMGVDAADVDGDGRTDLFVTNLSGETNSLYRQEAGGHFLDRTRESGLAEASVQYVGFGARFFDADNDGDQDLMVANGHVIANIEQIQPMYRYRQPNLYFVNDGTGRFLNLKSFVDGPSELEVGRGIATADLDDDGDLDILLTNNDGPVRYLENRVASGDHWIGFALEGQPGNPTAVGTQVVLTNAGKPFVQEVRAGGSYLSTSDPRVHFGLGPTPSVDAVTVHWPGGKTTALRDLEVDRYHRVVEPE